MSCTRSRAAIQELVDGTLGAIRTAELRQHLETCESCRALADDLQRLRDAAASLDSLVPPSHLWLQIAGRLRQEGRVHDRPAPVPPRRLQYAWLGVAAALVLAVGAALMLVVPRTPDDAGAPAPTAEQSNAAAADAVQSGIEDLRQAEKLLQSGVEKLKKGLGSDGQLPAEMARTLDANLQILDQAISDSSAAVRQDPQNLAARNSLFDALQRKISLLQDTINLMNEMRKGNAAGAAQVFDGKS
jgi:hypothetical protein